MADQFLRNVPGFEASGPIVHIPDWWKPGNPPRHHIRVNLDRQASGLGLDTMLDFNVEPMRHGEPLSDQERNDLSETGISWSDEMRLSSGSSLGREGYRGVHANHRRVVVGRGG